MIMVEDLQVGDVVTKIGSKGKFIVTNTSPTRGLPQYVTIMDKSGRTDDVWIRLIGNKEGFIDINYIFEDLDKKEMNNRA